MAKRSILLTIDDAEWNVFKSRVALSGASMAEVFKGFIRHYVTTQRKPKESIAKDVPADGPTLDTALGTTREKNEVPAGSERFRGDKTKERASMDDELLRHARTFDIPTEGKEEDALKEKVLDAIRADYKERKKLDGKGFVDYCTANSEMLEWYNGNRGE